MTGLRTTAARDDGRVVVVDDSVFTGDGLREVRATLAAAGKAMRCSTPPRSSPGRPARRSTSTRRPSRPREPSRGTSSITGSCSPGPASTSTACCPPTRWRTRTTTGPAYLEFLAGAQPLFVPSVPVKYVVTSRLEHAKHKADFYARSDTELFIESDYGQAVEIAARSGRQVFANDRREMVYPTPARAEVAAPGPFARSVARLPPGMVVAEQFARVRTLAARIRRSRRTRSR
ncbi:MAG: hypothetical protein ACXW08_17285 [Solirubrobacteraceae bacterium]